MSNENTNPLGEELDMSFPGGKNPEPEITAEAPQDKREAMYGEVIRLMEQIYADQGEDGICEFMLVTAKSMSNIRYMPDAVRFGYLGVYAPVGQNETARSAYNSVVVTGADFLPYEAYMKAFAVTAFKYNPNFNMVEFVRLYNEGASGIPKITTASWFSVTDPVVKQERVRAQLGTHIEEVSEMMQELFCSKVLTEDGILTVTEAEQRKMVEGYPHLADINSMSDVEVDKVQINLLIDMVTISLRNVATLLKTGKVEVGVKNEKKLADSFSDQLVTATGCEKVLGFDSENNRAIVDWSNFTKFTSFKPEYKAGSKVGKGYWFWEPEVK